MNKDLTKKQVRENVINFFGNDNLTTNHKTIENAIQNIETMEKGFKRKLKLLIASEEYEKYKEIPPKDKSSRCKPLVPPQSFESPHVSRKGSILNIPYSVRACIMLVDFIGCLMNSYTYRCVSEI